MGLGVRFGFRQRMMKWDPAHVELDSMSMLQTTLIKSLLTSRKTEQSREESFPYDCRLTWQKPSGATYYNATFVHARERCLN